MAKKTQRRNKRRTQRKADKRKSLQSSKMRGGNYFSVPIRAFYPQNTFENDASRQMTTSVFKGGSRRNHSRRYLKPVSGGSGFFPDFGTSAGATSATNQIMGSYQLNSGASLGPTYKV